MANTIPALDWKYRLSQDPDRAVLIGHALETLEVLFGEEARRVGGCVQITLEFDGGHLVSANTQVDYPWLL